MSFVVDGNRLLAAVVGFGRELHAAGVGGEIGATANFAQALTLVDIGDREQVQAAGRAVFVHRHEDIPTFDGVFERWWRRRPIATRPVPPRLGSDSAEQQPATASHRGRTSAEPSASSESRSYSAVEVLRRKEFAQMTSAELREAEQLIDSLRPALQRRPSRRYAPARRGQLSPRQMFRRNLSAGGDLVEWAWRQRRTAPRSLVVLCDVSGSMERHSRVLLRFTHALARANGVRGEAFVFGTRLTRVTRRLRDPDPDAALDRVSESVSDWSGGTRIGAALREFNIRWARRTLRSSGVVIVVSDGWDRGDAALVAEETARLRRSCHRLIWLNPLAGTPGYQPLTAGMAAALPHVDRFLPCGTLDSLDRLGDILSGAMA